MLCALAGLLWIIVLPGLTALGTSDPAGNAMAAGFAGLWLILLWILLSILALIAAVSGGMPRLARVVLLIVVPGSVVAALAALDLLAHRGGPPWQWPILVPAVAPPVAAGFCLWSLFRPPIHARAAAALLGALVLASLAVAPMQALRSARVTEEAQTGAELHAALARLPADAPLAEFVPFLEVRDQTVVSAAVARVQLLERRQQDAEALLARGAFPLRHLAWLALDPTPTLCDGARAMLRDRAARLVPASPGTQPFALIARDVADALNAMSWLVGHGCACEAESQAWESMAKAYRDTNYDVVLLANLRDPASLGRRLREDPERFSQLGAQSHLKAWLKFSDDSALRPQIIAGARTLAHRTADAVEILTNASEESGRFRLLRILPDIDLEATPALCDAAAREVGHAIKGVYRPAPSDPPLHYYDLIDRLGVARPLTTLVWLAEHGCDVREELQAAETAVNAYQDAPGRAAMLATLVRLQGK